jgi:hypothetical protein
VKGRFLILHEAVFLETDGELSPVTATVIHSIKSFIRDALVKDVVDTKANRGGLVDFVVQAGIQESEGWGALSHAGAA